MSPSSVSHGRSLALHPACPIPRLSPFTISVYFLVPYSWAQNDGVRVYVWGRVCTHMPHVEGRYPSFCWNFLELFVQGVVIPSVPASLVSLLDVQDPSPRICWINVHFNKVPVNWRCLEVWEAQGGEHGYISWALKGGWSEAVMRLPA